MSRCGPDPGSVRTQNLSYDVVASKNQMQAVASRSSGAYLSVHAGAILSHHDDSSAPIQAPEAIHTSSKPPTVNQNVLASGGPQAV